MFTFAGLISDDELHDDYVIPSPFDPRVADQVTEAVSKAAIETGVSRMNLNDSSSFSVKKYKGKKKSLFRVIQIGWSKQIRS
ncbi:hypothetical protein SAMN05192534_109113 [Alteribacillus persepolensis]|uniref:Uncharacterized protein n=1 Tax=Alteribacillus persepolensis TaxID=568899 RepID=A0A1G8EIJ8_9BACI|nr:hypothetical protein SAMN05192534_109113 [Alteribacillus persepolensis]